MASESIALEMHFTKPAPLPTLPLEVRGSLLFLRTYRAVSSTVSGMGVGKLLESFSRQPSATPLPFPKP